jgi:hypothetical protein
MTEGHELAQRVSGKERGKAAHIMDPRLYGFRFSESIGGDVINV